MRKKQTKGDNREEQQNVFQCSIACTLCQYLSINIHEFG